MLYWSRQPIADYLQRLRPKHLRAKLLLLQQPLVRFLEGIRIQYHAAIGYFKARRRPQRVILEQDRGSVAEVPKKTPSLRDWGHNWDIGQSLSLPNPRSRPNHFKDEDSSPDDDMSLALEPTIINTELINAPITPPRVPTAPPTPPATGPTPDPEFGNTNIPPAPDQTPSGSTTSSPPSHRRSPPTVSLTTIHQISTDALSLTEELAFGWNAVTTKRNGNARPTTSLSTSAASTSNQEATTFDTEAARQAANPFLVLAVNSTSRKGRKGKKKRRKRGVL